MRHFVYHTLLVTIILILQSCKDMSSLTATGAKTLDKLVETEDTTTLTLAMSAPAVVEVNQCVPLIIALKNANGDQVAAPTNYTVNVSGDTASLYGNSTCSTLLTSSVSIAKNSLSKIIYVRPLSNQGHIFELQEADSLVKPVSFILSVTNPVVNVDALKISVTGPSSLNAGQCRSYLATLQNASGMNKNAASAIALTMSGAGTGGSFYEGSNCSGAPVTSVTIASASSFIAFSYKNTVAENVNLVLDTPAGSDIQSGNISVQISALSTSTPTQLVLSGPNSVTAGACSGPVVVRSVDGLFNSSVTTANLPLTISGGAGFSIFSDASCTVALPSPQINASTSSTSFYFIVATAGNYVLAADDGASLTDASMSVSASASSGSAPVKLTITGPVSVQAADCSSAYVVKTTNGSGVETAVTALTVVNIGGKGAGDFYADSGCTSVISSLSFATGDSSKPFYYKGNSVANLTFNVDDAGPLTPASTSVSIVPDAPSQLILTGSASITLGECRAYTVTARDPNNFASAVASATAINLTGGGAGAFYSDSSCVTSTNSLIINAGQTASLFYYKSPSAAAVTLSADNSGVLTTGTFGVTVDPLPYTKVVFSRPALTAGACTAVNVSLKDSFNNNATATSAVGVNFSSTGSATFHNTSNCLGGPIVSDTIPMGQSNITVYLKDNVAEGVTLGLSATGLTSDSWAATVAAAANNRLILTGPATNSVGSCIGYDLRLEDSLGNLSPANSVTTVNFSGLSNAKFYSDVNCTTMAGSITLGAGSSLTQVYLKGTTAEALTIGASSGGLTPASKAVSLIAGTSNKIILTATNTALAGSCNAVTATIQDELNNPITQGSNVILTLSGNGSGSFYTTSACSTVTSSVTVLSGNSSEQVWFASNTPGSFSLNAQAAGLFDGTKTLTINPNAPTKLVMTGSATTTTGACTPYAITLQDTLNNLSSAGVSKTLNFSGALAGAFYSDSSCMLAAASISLSSSQTSAQIYYKATAAQTPNLTVDDTGLPDLVSSILPVTVTSSGGAATLVLKISGSTSINTNTCVPYAVMTTDSSGISTNVSSNMSVTMGGEGTGLFYSDSGCTTSSSTVTINAGTSLSYIYYKAGSAQNLVFSSTATGASANTLPVAITSGSGNTGASRLTIAGSTSILTNSCIPYVLSVADSNGNSTNAAANTTITLSGGGSGDFYTEDTCTTSAAGSATITAGTSYTTLYYKNGTVQSLIFVTQSTGLSNGTLSVGISSTSGGATSGPAVKLSFVGIPSSVASTNENFGSQPIVAVQDSNNNVASGASSTITLAAFTDSSCTLSAGSVLVATANPLNASGGVANFAGVNITSAQTVYLKASSPGLASTCSPAIQVYPSVAAKLAFSQQPSTTATAGVDFTVQPQISILNHTNQVVTNATNTVSINAYTDSSCTTLATGTFNVAANNLIPSSGLASFSGVNYSTTTTIYLKATSSGLTSACSSGVTINSAAPYQIGIHAQPATSGRAGDNFSMTVRLFDSYGNLSLATHNLALTAYKSSNCTGSTTAITGDTATTTLGTAVFSAINFSEADTMSIKVSDTTDAGVFTTCSNPIVVDGGTPTKLSFATQPAATGRIYTALTTAPVVRIEDTFSNLVKGATNNVTLTAYTDSGCSTTPATGTLSATNLVLSPSMGLASFTSLSYTVNETIYLKATSPGLTPVCSNAVVLSNLPAKMVTKNNLSCSVINGGVWCWGLSSNYHKLGDGTFANQTPFPVAVVGVGGAGFLTNITDVSLGGDHVCALSTAGNVYCWGYNGYGQLGDNTTTNRPTPILVKGSGGSGTLSNIVSISAGYHHTCAVNSSGNVYCWGYNAQGQLGNGSTTTRYYPDLVNGVSGAGYLSNIVSITSGQYYNCGLNSSGSVFCWGSNGNGQLGINSTSQQNYPVQVMGVGAVGTLGSITSLSAGSSHTCASNTTGNAYCWGENSSSQLGDSTTTQRTTPVQVLGVGGTGTLANVSTINAGNSSSCAITTSGAGYCWGAGSNGQLGQNNTSSSSTPLQIKGVGGTGFLSDLISISAGTTTCGLKSDGALYCWGYNAYGEIGDHTLTTRHTPVRVKDTVYSLFSSVSTGQYSSCGVLRERVYCWGYNANGQLGLGDTGNRSNPELITSLTGVKDVVVGYRHACALLKTGKVYCWGNNSYGGLGDNTTTQRLTPVQVVGPGNLGTLSDVVSLSAGYDFTCAVNSSGSAYCWGYNPYGQLGDNTTTNRSVPTQVVGVANVGTLAGVSSISTGWHHTCATTTAGVGYCWGYNGTNQIGDGTGTTRATPTQITGFTSGVTAISAGYQSSCGIKSGVGYCWGATTYSNGGSNASIGNSPQVIWPSGVTHITAGNELVCAVVNQKIKCYNASSSYAYHSLATNEVLKDMLTITVSSKDAGYPTICGLRNNGVVYCWGYNPHVSTFMGGTNSTASFPTVIGIPTISGDQHSSIATGEAHTCGILNGIAQCWGTSAGGALGSGITSTLTPKPVLLASTSANLGGQMSLGTGGTHSCSLSYGGEVFCWGDNTYGKLGNNSTIASTKAVQVLGVGGVGNLTGVLSLAVGYRHNCVIAGGGINCWGYNAQGQLGIDSTMSMATPIQVKGVGGSGYFTGASQVANGRYHTCALKSGNVYCWGSNQFGQLGANLAAPQSNTPVQVVSVSGVGVLDNVTAITAGAYHSCALAGGIVYCWGANASQQLGNDSTQDASYPVGVMNSGFVTLTGISSISSGFKHTCAVDSTNNTYCWGAGTYGQLGSNSTIDVGVASNVAGVGGSGLLTANIMATGSSANHTCALSTDQANIYCWGSGASGQIGNGLTPITQLLPTPVSVTSQPYIVVK